MPLHLNLLAITYFFAGLGILYISGFWLAAILFRDEDSSDLLLWAPLLGLSVVVVALSNLNYLGVPVKFSILVLLALSVAADLLVIRRFLWKRDAQTLNSPFIFWAIGISTALFLLPFILYGAFYQFNDAVYYSSVADFVRDRSYFASAEPAELYPWLAEMLQAQPGARMGAQYFLAAVSAILGVNAYSVFLPVTAMGVLLSICGFWLLARTVLQPRAAALLALVLYAFNAAMVHEIASLNFISQTLAFGPMFALVACGLSQPRLTSQNVTAAAILMAGLISVYPEILAIALVPILLSFLLDLLFKRQSVLRESLFGLVLIGVSVALNPYSAYNMTKSVAGAAQSAGGGIDFMHLTLIPGDTFFGLTGLHGYTTPLLAAAAHWIGIGMAAIAVLGLVTTMSRTRWILLFSGLAYVALAFYELYARNFYYGYLKAFVYGYYIVPLCGGAGLAYLLLHRKQIARSAAAAACACWFVFAGLAFYRLTATCYGWILGSNAPGVVTPIEYTQPLEELAAWSVVPKPGEVTLVICQMDGLDRWVPYFFRKPVSEMFPSVYFSAIWDRPKPGIQQVDYLLTMRSGTSLKDERQALFVNRLFAFSRTQTVLVATTKGFWETELDGSHFFQWMSQRGHVLVLAPEPDTISIRATVRLTPDGKPRHLRVLMNHQLIRSLYLEQPDTPLEVNDLSLNGGSNDLVFETDEPGKKFGSDPRDLALSIRDLGIVQPPPSSLSLRDGSEVASVQGLTPDRWITAAGAEADLGVPPATSEVLVKVAGEAINGTVPGELALIFDGQTLHSEKIIKSGPTTLTFSVSLKHPTGTLHLRLLPKTTARPVDLNMGTDTRQLGFRLSAIQVVRALAR